MVNATVKDVRVKKELDRLVDLFKSESLPNTIQKAFISNGNKPSAKWSLSNKIIMLANETADARGFNQWNSVSRYVKKGTHAFYILGPRMIKVKEINEETKQEEEKQVLSGFIAIPVFKYEDTEGQAIPETQPKELPELYHMAQKIGVKVEYQENNGMKAWGYFSPTEKQIVLFTHDKGTFYHELTHAIQAHLEGVQKGAYESEEYKLNEIVAQLTSAVISSMYNINVEGYTYNYIKYYASMLEQYGTDNDKIYKSIMRVIGKVEKILNFIFS